MTGKGADEGNSAELERQDASQCHARIPAEARAARGGDGVRTSDDKTDNPDDAAWSCLLLPCLLRSDYELAWSHCNINQKHGIPIPPSSAQSLGDKFGYFRCSIGLGSHPPPPAGAQI